MKKIIIYFTVLLVFVVFGTFLYLTKLGASQEHKLIQKQQESKDNIGFLKDYLIKEYKDNYPIPKGDVIYLDKNLRQIHLEDKTKPMEMVDNLYVIQGNTCGLEIDNIQFNSSKSDPKYSTGDNLKCYSYSVTKDRKNFQIGGVEYSDSKEIARLVGSIDKSITRDFQSNTIVKDGYGGALPYSPFFNTNIRLYLLEGKASVKLTSSVGDLKLPKDFNEKAKSGIDLPWDNVELTDLKIAFLGKKYLYKLVYPNGNIQLISPNDKGKAEIVINEFNYDGLNSTTSITTNLGKIVYNLVKMSDDSDYKVMDSKGGVITVRGTKFTLDFDDEISSTYLAEGSVDITLGDAKFIINSLKNVFGVGLDKKIIDLFKDPTRLRALYSYAITSDLLLNPLKSYMSKQSEMNITGDSYSYIMSGNDLSEPSVYEIVDKDFSSSEYTLIGVKGYFGQELAVDLLQNRFYANQKLSDICIENGFSKLVGLNDIYGFLKIKNLFDGNVTTFQSNDTLKDLFGKMPGYSLIIDNKTDSNTNITYLDTKDGQIKYTNISSHNSDDKRDGFMLICEK